MDHHALTTTTAAVLLAGVALTGCGGADGPAASSPATGTSSAPATAATTTSTTPGTSATTPAGAPTTPPDPALVQALEPLARELGAQASSVSVGDDGMDGTAVAVVAAPDAETGGTELTFLAWSGAAWQEETDLEVAGPLLEGADAPLQWQRLTAGRSYDAVVSLRGGSAGGGVEAAVVRRTAPGQWRVVPLVGGALDGSDAQTASAPDFDGGPVFATRVEAAGEVVTTRWVYDADRDAFVTTEAVP